MKNIDHKAQLFVLLVLGSLAMVVGACTLNSIQYPVYMTERLTISNASSQALTITEYRYSSNVSYAELTSFLANDTTYLADYEYPNHTCGDFAVVLHDRAEAQGIDCGIVGVEFNSSGDGDNNTSKDFSLKHDGVNVSVQGHGFDVFNTTDRGLVYVDVTGITQEAKEKGYQPHVMTVYVEQGKPLGEIAIGQAGNFDYAYYEGKESQFKAYERNVSDFLNEAQAYDTKVESFNDTYKAYQADQAAFDRKYDNFSDELRFLKGSSDIDLESSISLEAQRKMLLQELDALDARLDDLQKQGTGLDAEKASLEEKRASLEQDTADGAIIIAQWGVVDRMVVQW